MPENSNVPEQESYMSESQAQMINDFTALSQAAINQLEKEYKQAESAIKQDVKSSAEKLELEKKEQVLDKTLSFKEKIKFFYQDQLKDNIFVILTILFFVYLLVSISWTFRNFFTAIYYIDWRYFRFDIFSVVSMYLPFGVFIFATAFRFWSYRTQRKSFLYLCLLNIIVFSMTIIFRVMYCVSIPVVARMPIVEGITPAMLVLLARLIIALPVLLFGVFVSVKMYLFVSNSLAMEEVLSFKITNVIDTRKNRKYLYDVKLIRNLSTGRMFTIREDDRFLHTLDSGTTGTGKTSMSLTTKFCDDLDKRILNEDTRNQKIYKAIKDGKAYLSSPVIGDFPDISTVKARPGYEKDIEDLIKKYRVCGLTCVAPNSGLIDELYNLCLMRGIKPNRIDPILDPNTNLPKEGSKGFNPMYVSPSLTGVTRELDYVKKATLLADVMQSLNEMKGKGDAYFIGVNRSVTTSFCMLLELTYSILNNGKQPHPGILRDLINDFSRAKPYYEELCKLDSDNKYTFIKDFIQNDILGPGKEKMWDQSRGLRNLFNDFLMNPLYKRILCSEDSIDMDDMLSQGQITLVNYALELGQCDSVAFGLFFAISFNDAVLRRPGTDKTRLPHFYDIDEFPVLLHPQMEKCFSLFRQYKVAMTVAIQSIDQMDKSETTRYLKNVIMGNCAHHIVFGRCSASEMEYYSKLSGSKYTTQSTYTTNQTSMTTDKPSISYSNRELLEETAVASPTSVRKRNFQEVTVFSVINGSMLEPFLGRMNFLKKEKRRTVKRYQPNWNELLKTNIGEITYTPPSTISEGIFFTSQGVINHLPVKEQNSYSFIDGGKSLESTDSYEYDDSTEDKVLHEEMHRDTSITEEQNFNGIEI